MKFALMILAGLLVLAGLFYKGSPQAQVGELKGEVFGSYYLIKYADSLQKEKFEAELNWFFQNFNHEFSTYQNNSVISRFNELGPYQKLKVSPRFIEMLNLARKLYEETGGALDPTLGPLVKAWGFGGGSKPETPPSQTELDEAREKMGFKFLRWNTHEVWKTRPGVQLDVNAFVPGLAADLIGRLLEKNGVQNYMIDISGEILIKGEKPGKEPWIIGIEKPSQEYAQGVQLALKMKDGAVATSGNYRQFFDDHGKRRSHILDPRTGLPVNHQIASASVIADSAARADAWGTAMMVLGEEGRELAQKAGVKFYLLEALSTQEYRPIISPEMQKYIEENGL